MHLTPDYALIRCEGPDALRFLQGQLSADISAVHPNKGAMACDINLKGRVMVACYVYACDQGFHLIVPQDQKDYFLADLKKYAVFSKVTLSDLSHEVHVCAQLAEQSLKHPAYEVSIDQQGAIFWLTDKAYFHISSTQAISCRADDWFIHLMTHGIPTITAAARELFLPHYIGMIDLGAISFDKGCYKGQEVVARMQYRANLKKQMVYHLLAGEQALNPGDQIGEAELVNAYAVRGQTHTLMIMSHMASL